MLWVEKFRRKKKRKNPKRLRKKKKNSFFDKALILRAFLITLTLSKKPVEISAYFNILI